MTSNLDLIYKELEAKGRRIFWLSGYSLGLWRVIVHTTTDAVDKCMGRVAKLGSRELVVSALDLTKKYANTQLMDNVHEYWSELVDDILMYACVMRTLVGQPLIQTSYFEIIGTQIGCLRCGKKIDVRCKKCAIGFCDDICAAKYSGVHEKICGPAEKELDAWSMKSTQKSG